MIVVHPVSNEILHARNEPAAVIPQRARPLIRINMAPQSIHQLGVFTLNAVDAPDVSSTTRLDPDVPFTLWLGISEFFPQVS